MEIFECWYLFITKYWHMCYHSYNHYYYYYYYYHHHSQERDFH